MSDKGYLVQGFVFVSKGESETALKEKVNIEYAETHVNYEEPAAVLRIYKNMIEKKIFQTPVGYQYLSDMRRYLLQKDIPETDIPYIVVAPKSYDAEKDSKPTPRELALIADNDRKTQKIKDISALNKGMREFAKFSIVAMAVLAAAIAAMFIIVVKSDNPNIINYEKLIQNRYSEWEQTLKEREEKLWESEQKLNERSN